MATEQDTLIATLDAKIEELQTMLDALRRTRVFFAAERERQGILDTHAQTSAEDERRPETQPADAVHFPTQLTKSIGMMILDHLNEVGGPIHVDELMPKLRNKGSQASRQTVIGTLARYKKEGKLRRVAQNTYTLKKLPPQQQNATYIPQESQSVKPAEQSIQPGTREYECYTILKAQGAFMTLREMLDALMQSGAILNTPKPLDLLGGVMRQSIRRGKRIFVRNDQGRFGLHEWQNSQVPLHASINLEHVQSNGNSINVDSVSEV
jgi:hypothetical protein